MSGLTWMDSSDAERRKALEVIDMFRDESTVDELGLGSIRDALSDLLFPGTSTIMTRLRYYLFVPWVYAELLHARTAAQGMKAAARKRQDKLRVALCAGGEAEGVIGFRAKLKGIGHP